MNTTHPPQPHSPAIQVQDAVKTFRTRSETVRAVQGVSLEVPRGGVVALLGPNGAGKTTLLDMVLGMSEPTSGAVSVCGERPRAAVAHGKVGAVQQVGGLLADLSVRETVTMIASLYPDHLPVDEALERAGAASFARRKVAKCSGGQQQRVRFALALLPRPELLVLDEPTAGMDVQSRTEFWDAMRAETERGLTVVFATHYLQEAEDVAERIVLMDAGRVTFDGSVDELRSTSRHHTVSFVWPAGEPLPEFAGATVSRRSESRVHLRTEDADALARELLTRTPASALEISRGGLDEAFAALVRHDDAAA
ncbi:ABC transporter ATP-binding protein [Kocuria varians]|uniref:Putative ABC transporter ATP-binding protein YxlF n=1 Tax=Kocuria varians TaxID=1272 RepID=A0A7D7PUE0_KOCVA|nr:ABC transporter ATP-binding protein [Kocuria varians]QMS57692.1 putative ABC transporter ATP-binding protein YxlF [Kocuria varians]